MADVLDTHNTITSTEAIDIIKTSIKSVMADHELSKIIPPTLLRGAPGVGKSTIVKQIAKDLDIGFIDVRLAQMERVDVCGLPSIENGQTKWNVPDMMPADPNSSGILFFDELTAAPQDVQVAAYSLVLDRKIPNSNYTLPDGWYIVAAGNRVGDRAVARPLSSALANRFAHYELDTDEKEWNDWAVAHSIHPSVTGFLKYRPTLLFKMEGQNLECGWPSPRSWERVSSILPLFNGKDEVLKKVVFGLIGESVGCEFLAFHAMQKKFDDVLEILTNPKAEVNISEKSDEKYAFCSALIYHLWNGKSEEDDKQRVEGLFKVIMKLTPDFATMVIRAASQGNKRINRITALKLLMTNKSYVDFQKKFSKSAVSSFSLDI